MSTAASLIERFRTIGALQQWGGRSMPMPNHEYRRRYDEHGGGVLPALPSLPDLPKVVRQTQVDMEDLLLQMDRAIAHLAAN